MLSLTPLILAATLIPAQVADTVGHASSCNAQPRPASIVQSVQADYPEVARSFGIDGTTKVRVDLSAAGNVVGTAVVRSSGNAMLDAAALRTARAMTFAPEVRDCTAIGGSYAVDVHFTS